MKLKKLNPDDTQDLKDFLHDIEAEFGVVRLRDFCSDIMTFSIAICTIIDQLDRLTKDQDEYDDTLTKTILINSFKLVAQDKAFFRTLLTSIGKYGDVVKKMHEGDYRL